MDIDLSRFTEAELLELNRRIVERIRLLRQGRCRERMAAFDIGDRVAFHHERGHEVLGTIVRLNQKSVSIVSTDGVHWRVAPALLTKVLGQADGDTDEDAKLIAKVQGDLLELAERKHRDRGKA